MARDFVCFEHGGLRVGRAWWFAGGPRAGRDFFGLNMMVRGWVVRSPRFFWFEHGGPRVGRAQRANF